jgi:hypothetical protein
MFSSRLPAGLAPNAISQAATARRSRGPVFDLTESNPTAVRLPYPPDVLTGLADASALRYDPSPLGLAAAREAVAADYARAGHVVAPDRVVLTASTSEAYAFLFKLLCDPGDDVLVPQPSYPLFDLLTTLEGVVARPYRLDDHSRWAIDRASVGRACSDRTRAILIVNPNNPTGSRLRAGDRDWIDAIAADRGWAIIADEVFADYPLRAGRDAVSMLGETRALTFVLGGLSKSAGLPQVKLGWMAVGGPDALVRPALERLDVIADAYLSVSTPAQIAAASLIDAGRAVRAAIQARIAANLASLERIAPPGSAVSLLPPEGGWSAVLRVPATLTEEALVLRLINEAGVIVHPGFFFDFDHGAHLVVSLLPEPHVFDAGIAGLVATCTEAAS